ncbi:MAG: hypothetical protein RR961_09525, partial [Eubacterium sp.]
MEAPKCVQEQEKRLYEALSANDSATISAKALADALGEGVSEKAIINAAAGGTLPFGWMHQSHIKDRRSTAIIKGAVWNWYKKGIL